MSEKNKNNPVQQNKASLLHQYQQQQKMQKFSQVKRMNNSTIRNSRRTP